MTKHQGNFYHLKENQQHIQQYYAMTILPQFSSYLNQTYFFHSYLRIVGNHAQNYYCVMHSSNHQTATPKETMKKELQVYIGVEQKMAIDQFTFKASLQENNQETEVWTYEPPNNSSSEEEFKQLAETFYITLKFEAKQYLNITVLQRGTRKLFGKIQNLTVGQLYGSRLQGVRKVLRSGEHELCTFFVHFQSREGENHSISLQVETDEIQADRFCFLCSPDSYYFTITKHLLNREYVVYRSKPTKSPSDTFERIEISTRRLCNNLPNQDFFLNFLNSSNDRIIGRARTSLTLLQRQGNIYVENGKKNNGRVLIKHQKKERQYEFSEFFDSGMQLALVVGIDFTHSNLPFNDKDSLHYFKGASKSYYETALQEVTGILLQYDYDKKVPVYGFGAKVNYNQLNSGNHAMDCFPITGLKQQHDLFELNGIMKAYRDCLPHLTFAGPTLFAPILRQSIAVCKDMKDEGRQYMILQLITDGDISDFQQVVDLIVECGRLPISIVIIGISKDTKEQWPLMKKLDDNKLQLRDSMGRKSQRDLVKFVQFMKYYQIPGQLSQQVLEELPKQVEEYHKLVKIIPQDYLNRRIIPDGDNAKRRNQEQEFEQARNVTMKSKRVAASRNPEEKEQKIEIQMKLEKSKKIKKKQESKPMHDEVDASLINIKVDMMESKVNKFALKNYTPEE